MNYRTLFIISFMIIALGFGGLFLIGDQHTDNPPQNSEESAVKTTAEPPKEEKTITVAIATKPLMAGQILKKEDYRLTDVKVISSDTGRLAKMKADLLALFGENQVVSLEGFLLTENVAAESQLSTEMLISPNDNRFLIENLGEGQVAYRIYIKTENQFLLDSLTPGDLVSIYAKHKNYQFSRENKDNVRMDEMLKNLEILKIERFGDEQQTTNSAFQKDYVGYVSVKMAAEQLTALFRLSSERELLPIPKVKSKMPANSRGATIRSLRG